VAVASASAIATLVFKLVSPDTDWLGLATLGAAALFNGLASASLTVLLQSGLAQMLGMTTPLQLVDLTRPDHPLLQFMLREAPGTYQHSLQVANLAEQAAEAVGADPLLIRVGALYHDAGKALNPIFFIENQLPGFPNPHEQLDPQASARIIIRHVTDGIELAKKYRLPRRIYDFVLEHHGAMLTRYQYAQAVKAAGGKEDLVDKEQFQYPGPRPRSRETAILMLADGCEARVRAEHPTEDKLREVIKSVIDNRVAIGELDDTSLTLNDLDLISRSFTATLRGIYHPRVQYPGVDVVPTSTETVTTPLPRPELPGASNPTVPSSSLMPPAPETPESADGSALPGISAADRLAQPLEG
jgi:putative nucleotidyltransferase with HDIG domain